MVPQWTIMSEVPDLPPSFDAWRRAPRTAAVLVDFDGTLATIVDDPDTARPLSGAVEVLSALAARAGLVAVISGRPVAFLAKQMENATGVQLSGLYGLEVIRDGVRESHPGAERWRRTVAEVVARARAQAPPGVIVEDKGTSVTLHVRRAPDQDSWAARWAAGEAARAGLECQPGRRAYELRPPVRVDKGTALEALVSGAAGPVHAICFIGDDRGDLAAFEALDRLAVGTNLTCVRVAVRSDESPAELIAAADLVVQGPDGALDLLRAIVASW